MSEIFLFQKLQNQEH